MRAVPSGLTLTLLLAGCYSSSATPSAPSSPRGDCTRVDSASSLESAIRDAEAGAVICISAGEYALTDPLVVRVPLTIEARGEVTLLGSSRLDAVLRIEAPAHLTGLSFESAASFAIRAGNVDSLALDRIAIRATRGVGLGVQDVAALHMNDVSIEGSIEWAHHEAVPDDAPTHGLVLLRIGEATLEDVASSGFALFGALVIDSNTTWTRGAIDQNIGTGLMVYAGTTELTGLAISDIWQGGHLMPAYGAVFARATVHSTGLSIARSATYGILEHLSDTEHMGLDVSDSEAGGLWTQGGATRIGERSRFANNQGSGIFSGDSALTVEDSAVIETEIRRRVVNAFPVDFADGIDIAHVSRPVRLANLELVSNARVGLLIDLEAVRAPIDLENIRVSGDRGMLGAVVVNGTSDPAWNAEIERVNIDVDDDVRANLPGLGSFGDVEERDPLPARISLEDAVANDAEGPSD